jgi:hypothetical protein
MDMGFDMQWVALQYSMDGDRYTMGRGFIIS